MGWENLIKYFVHGLVFHLLLVVLFFGWVFVTVALAVVGALIGLILAIGLLILIIGFANAIVTSRLWFSVKSGFWDILFHGLAFFVVLLITEGLFVWTPQHFAPSLLTTVITFVLACFVDGYAGRWIASFWQEEYLPDYEQQAEAANAEWRQEKVQPRF